MLNAMHRYDGGGAGKSDSTSLVNLSAITLTYDGGRGGRSDLKANVQKEYDAPPPVALWDSWLYRSWKADRDMVNPLAENWQHLLGIFSEV